MADGPKVCGELGAWASLSRGEPFARDQAKAPGRRKKQGEAPAFDPWAEGWMQRPAGGGQYGFAPRQWDLDRYRRCLECRAVAAPAAVAAVISPSPASAPTAPPASQPVAQPASSPAVQGEAPGAPPTTPNPPRPLTIPLKQQLYALAAAVAAASALVGALVLRDRLRVGRARPSEEKAPRTLTDRKPPEVAIQTQQVKPLAAPPQQNVPTQQVVQSPEAPRADPQPAAVASSPPQVAEQPLINRQRIIDIVSKALTKQRLEEAIASGKPHLGAGEIKYIETLSVLIVDFLEEHRDYQRSIFEQILSDSEDAATRKLIDLAADPEMGTAYLEFAIRKLALAQPQPRPAAPPPALPPPPAVALKPAAPPAAARLALPEMQPISLKPPAVSLRSPAVLPPPPAVSLRAAAPAVAPKKPAAPAPVVAAPQPAPEPPAPVPPTAPGPSFRERLGNIAAAIGARASAVATLVRKAASAVRWSFIALFHKKSAVEATRIEHELDLHEQLRSRFWYANSTLEEKLQVLADLREGRPRQGMTITKGKEGQLTASFSDSHPDVEINRLAHSGAIERSARYAARWDELRGVQREAQPMRGMLSVKDAAGEEAFIHRCLVEWHMLSEGDQASRARATEGLVDAGAHVPGPLPPGWLYAKAAADRASDGERRLAGWIQRMQDLHAQLKAAPAYLELLPHCKIWLLNALSKAQPYPGVVYDGRRSASVLDGAATVPLNVEPKAADVEARLAELSGMFRDVRSLGEELPLGIIEGDTPEKKQRILAARLVIERNITAVEEMRRLSGEARFDWIRMRATKIETEDSLRSNPLVRLRATAVQLPAAPAAKAPAPAAEGAIAAGAPAAEGLPKEEPDLRVELPPLTAEEQAALAAEGGSLVEHFARSTESREVVPSEELRIAALIKRFSDGDPKFAGLGASLQVRYAKAMLEEPALLADCFDVSGQLRSEAARALWLDTAKRVAFRTMPAVVLPGQEPARRSAWERAKEGFLSVFRRGGHR